MKYRFDQPPINEGVVDLIKVILCMLESQIHTCTGITAAPRSLPFTSRGTDLISSSPNLG